MKIAIHLPAPEFDIKLIQHGVDNFTVQYGEEYKSQLTYSEAALELGAAMMHNAALQGKLNSSLRFAA